MKSVAWKIFGILDSKSPKGFLGSTPKTWQEYNRRLKNSARRAQEVVLMLMGAVVTAAVHEKAEPELVHSGDRLT